jgi:hypothetical protein
VLVQGGRVVNICTTGVPYHGVEVAEVVLLATITDLRFPPLLSCTHTMEARRRLAYARLFGGDFVWLPPLILIGYAFLPVAG